MAIGQYENLNKRLQNGEHILLDGGVGSEVVRRGARWVRHGLRDAQDIVSAIHNEYLSAGADVIRTNTFQLSHRCFRNVFRDKAHMRAIGAPGLENRAIDLTRIAVRLAKDARKGAEKGGGAAIAGSVGPLNHCFRSDLAPVEEVAFAEHKEMMGVLAEEGVDLVLIESMNTIRESRAALRAANECGIPAWISFICGNEETLLSGEPIADWVKAIEAINPQALLVNCAPPPLVTDALSTLKKEATLPVGTFAHIGRYNPPSWKFEFFPQFSDTEEWPPDRYLPSVRQWINAGAQIVGGCCGTTPAHVAALRSHGI